TRPCAGETKPCSVLDHEVLDLVRADREVEDRSNQVAGSTQDDLSSAVQAEGAADQHLQTRRVHELKVFDVEHDVAPLDELRIEDAREFPDGRHVELAHESKLPGRTRLGDDQSHRHVYRHPRANAERNSRQFRMSIPHPGRCTLVGVPFMNCSWWRLPVQSSRAGRRRALPTCASSRTSRWPSPSTTRPASSCSRTTPPFATPGSAPPATDPRPSRRSRSSTNPVSGFPRNGSPAAWR